MVGHNLGRRWVDHAPPRRLLLVTARLTALGQPKRKLRVQAHELRGWFEGIHHPEARTYPHRRHFHALAKKSSWRCKQPSPKPLTTVTAWYAVFSVLQAA